MLITISKFIKKNYFQVENNQTIEKLKEKY